MNDEELKAAATSTAHICAKCGGKCCQGYPGACYPQDFGTTKEEVWAGVEAAIKTGLYCFDCWENFSPEGQNSSGGENGWFVRPSMAGKTRLIDRAYGGKCHFWSREKGCAHSYEKRPTGCRMFIAAEPAAEGCYYEDGTNGVDE